MNATTRTDGELLIHQALLYGSEAEFTEAAAAFLTEGRAADEPSVAIVSEERLARLRKRLDDFEGHRAEDWFVAPARTLAAYLETASTQWWPRGRLRLLVEPLWTGLSAAESREWRRLEAVLNVVLEGTRTWMICAYDATALPADVLADAARTHHGPDFVDPEIFYLAVSRTALAPPVEPVAHRGFTRGELPGVRQFIGQAATALGLQSTLALVMAANEVATNIIQHGGGQGSVWVWSDGRSVLCDLLDPLHAFEDRLAGYIPPTLDQGYGAGMWAVRQLCDLVEIRSGSSGTVFRLHARLRP